MKVSQKTLAKRLKLSESTVSRALKNDPVINAETRRLVLHAAHDLGFIPREKLDRAGSRQCKPLSLGILIQSDNPVNSIHNLVHHQILQGFSQAAAATGATVQIQFITSDESAEFERNNGCLPMIKDRTVDGLVLLGTFTPAALQTLSSHFTCVRIIYRSPEVLLDCIDHDDIDSVEQLVTHLRQLGHRQIGFVTHGEKLSYASARFAGYVEALARENLPLIPSDIINVFGDRLETPAAAQTVAKRIRQGTTAWICVHDGFGYGLAHELGNLGLKIPRDASLAGFDNFDPPAGLPKLTSIDVPFEAMGAAALRRLVLRLNNKAETPIRVMFRCRIIKGESTGPFAPPAPGTVQGHKEHNTRYPEK